MSTFDPDHNLGELFHACDLDGSGFIDKEELAYVCKELSVEDLCDVFKQLDTDGDDRISLDEFAKGYRKIVMAKETKKRQLIRQRLASAKLDDNLTHREDIRNNPGALARGLDEGLKALSCQEEVCQLYQDLHRADKPELVDQFEGMLLTVINDVHQYQLENERLQKTYKREKEEHLKHLQRLEEEIEHQVQSVEERVRKQEKEKLESEKIELRNQLNSEIVMLQHNLRKLQESGGSKMNNEERLVTLKKRLEDIRTENRMLKSELTDAKTNLALTKSQMTTVKHQLDEKSYELQLDNKTVLDYVNEIDKLRTQLHMLHDANKHLLDTNDSLRERLESPEGSSAFRHSISIDSALSPRSGGTPSPSYPRKDLLMNDCDDTHQLNYSELNRPLRAEIMMISQFVSEDDNCAEDLDSGHSTLRDGVDGNDDTELDNASIHSDTTKESSHRKLSQSSKMYSMNLDSYSEMETDTERPDSPDTEVSTDHKRSPSASKRGLIQKMDPLIREKVLFSQYSKSTRVATKRQLSLLSTRDLMSPIKVSRDPDRMYKLVLAGDAAVGKSSFILQLCKGKFSYNLSSTLGVDFQTKLIDVDGHSTALQLWDTAGQERFRSVAKTYFRRADGVILLYDVTYERSFLSLREWVNFIEKESKDGSLKRIPIMLVGNKIDAREEMKCQGRRVVSREDGCRFSQEADTLFIETSAKNGANIMEAVIELTRLLRRNEDLEVKTVGLQLQEIIDKKKSGSCCKR